MIHCALGNNYSSNSLTVIRSLVKNPTLRLLTAEFEVSVVSTSDVTPKDRWLNV